MRILKAIIDSFKSDYSTLRGLIKNPKDYTFDFTRIIKPQYFILLLIVSFLCGALISAKYYETKTNEIIFDVCSDGKIVDYEELIRAINNYKLHANNYDFYTGSETEQELIEELMSNISSESKQED